MLTRGTAMVRSSFGFDASRRSSYWLVSTAPARPGIGTCRAISASGAVAALAAVITPRSSWGRPRATASRGRTKSACRTHRTLTPVRCCNGGCNAGAPASDDAKRATGHDAAARQCQRCDAGRIAGERAARRTLCPAGSTVAAVRARLAPTLVAMPSFEFMQRDAGNVLTRAAGHDCAIATACNPLGLNRASYIGGMCSASAFGYWRFCFF